MKPESRSIYLIAAAYLIMLISQKYFDEKARKKYEANNARLIELCNGLNDRYSSAIEIIGTQQDCMRILLQGDMRGLDTGQMRMVSIKVKHVDELYKSILHYK